MLFHVRMDVNLPQAMPENQATALKKPKKKCQRYCRKVASGGICGG